MSSPGVLRFDVTTGRGRYTSECSRVFCYVWAGETGFQHRVYAYIVVCGERAGEAERGGRRWYTRIRVIYRNWSILLLRPFFSIIWGHFVRSATLYSRSKQRIFLHVDYFVKRTTMTEFLDNRNYRINGSYTQNLIELN